MGPRTVRQCWENFTRGSSSRVSISEFLEADGRQGIADGPRLRRTGGSPDVTYMGCRFLLPPPNGPLSTKISLPFSLKHEGETSRSRLFGVVPGRSESITGHFATIFIMSSRYFVKSLTLVLGFHHWKELGLGSLICFWAMDS